MLIMHTRKDEGLIKRLSNTRMRHATPTLQLQVSRPTTASVETKAEPTFGAAEVSNQETMDDETIWMPQSASPIPSQPLQEIAANASPRKRPTQTHVFSNLTDTESMSDQRKSSVAQDTKPIPPFLSPRKPSESPKRSQSPEKQTAPTAPAQPPQDLAADLASLLSRRASRTDSAKAAPPQRRKSKPLGRALSNMSSRGSLISADSRGGICPFQEEESEHSFDGDRARQQEPQPPSTQLEYGQPEAEEARAKVSKSMGTVFADESAGTRVASLGTVKDTDFTRTGVGGRVRGRNRAAK